jgi:hypothetical protein
MATDDEALQSTDSEGGITSSYAANDGVVLKVPYSFFGSIYDDDERSMAWKAMNQDTLTMGPQVAAFQKEFAAMCGVSHAFAVSNCTTAMHVATQAFGIGPGDEVIVTPNTFIATSLVILKEGGTPVYADIDPMTFNIEENYYREGYSRRDGGYFQLYEAIDPTSPFNDGDDYTYSGKMSYKVKAPMQFGLGIALGRPGGSMVAFDVNYENWKQAKLEYPSDFAQEPNYFLDKYRAATTWKIGVEQPIPVLGGVIRAGYMRHPLTFVGPRTGEDGAPLVEVSNDRDYLTLGIGKQFDQSFGIDVGYTRGFWTTKENPRSDEESRDNVFVAITWRGPGK